jgi:hypothetical protein
MFQFTLPQPLASLKSSCEVYCSAACCGLGAFEVAGKHIEPWISDNGLPRTFEALTQLEELTHAIQAQRGGVVSDMHDFGDGWQHASECVEYLELWQRETVAALLTVAAGHLFQPAWLSANGAAVGSIVRAVAETGDFAHLPVLADALEEAGCPVEEMLAHGRRGGRHARRCWLVDLLLAGQERHRLGALTQPRSPLPRRNRVTPFGDLIAVRARGTLMGNRGRLHDDQQRIQRDHNGRRWLLCRLAFNGRRRSIMTPGHYTELFFLDEATGLAAGHRPCFECQRPRFNAFRAAFIHGNPGVFSGAPLAADDIDRRLDRERHPPGRRRPLREAALDDLPAGVMVLLEDDEAPFLVQSRRLLPWRPEGYGPALARPREARVRVLTPGSTVNAIAAGYTVGVHPTATV